MRKIILITNIAPHYREAIWSKLLNDSDNEFQIYYGEDPHNRIKTIDFTQIKFYNHRNKLNKIKNYWWKNKIVIWQKGVVKACLQKQNEVIILLGDMYCISTWLSAVICRIMRKRVIFWSHGIYGNEKKIKLFIRLLFLRLANAHLLYEKRAKNILVKYGFRSDSLYIVFNSLDYEKQKTILKKIGQLKKKETVPFYSNYDLPLIVFIGRLTNQKKIEYLIEAHNNINKNREITNLLIIGDGPNKRQLIELGKTALKNKSLYFIGSLYNEEDICAFLSVSDLCVSPGNVGLTAIHSLTYGTPVCTHNNYKKQNPEVEAIISGYNGILFNENDIDDLEKKIKEWIECYKNQSDIKERCIEVVDLYYNPKYQINVINKAIKSDKPDI